MGSSIERLALLITANADGLITTLREVGAASTATFSKVEGEAEVAGAGAGNKFGGALNSGVVTGLATVAATMAAFKGIAFAKDAVSTAVDFNVATAQVNATLKATGDVSGATAGGIDRMSSSIEGTQAIFAGTVKQGAALLLTFTDIRNQAGVGNNIFDRALQVSSAASNVLGKDLNTTIIQIGKALENPETSLTNLQRSGLALNQIDKQRIIALAKQGDLLGAQSALLDALEAKGLVAAGAAVAKANPIQQFQVASAELKKTLGEDLLPAATELLHLFQGVFGAIEHLPAPLRESVELVTVLGALVVPLLALRKAGGALGALSENAKGGGLVEGAAAVDSAGTSAATKITQSATTIDAAATSGAEKLAAVAPQLEAALSSGAAAVAGAGTTGATRVATGAVASTAPAVASEKELTAAITEQAGAADIAAGSNAAMAESLALFGPEVATISVAFDLVDKHALAASRSLGTIVESSGGIFVAGEASRTFAVEMGAAAEATDVFAVGLDGVAVSSRAFAVGAAQVATAVDSTAGELTFFNVQSTDAVTGVASLGTELELLEHSMLLTGTALKADTTQLALFGDKLLTIPGLAAAAAGSLAELDAAAGFASKGIFGAGAIGGSRGPSVLPATETGQIAATALANGGAAAAAPIGEAAAAVSGAGVTAGAAIGNGAAAVSSSADVVALALANGGKVAAETVSSAIESAATAGAVELTSAAEAMQLALARGGAIAAAAIEAAAGGLGSAGLLGTAGAGYAKGGLFAGVTAPEEAAVGGGLFGLGKGTKLLGEGSFLGKEVGSFGAFGGAAGGAIPSISGLGLGGFAAAGFAGYESFKKTYDLLGPAHKSFQDITNDAKGFAASLRELDHTSNLDRIAGFKEGAINQDKSDIKGANAGLTQILDTQGPLAASAAYEKFKDSIVAVGGDATEVAGAMDPFITKMSDAFAAEGAAQRNADAYANSLVTLKAKLDDIKSNLAIVGDLRSLGDSQTQLKADKADAAGTGDKAVAAVDSAKSAYQSYTDQLQTNINDIQKVKDASTSLEDAQGRLITSTHSLTAARAALALYDSPRGAQERSLQLDIIQRRVVTTPGESDQKQLDLLQFQDQQGQKKQQLQDAVVSAATSERDAYKGVADARNAITDAQLKVQKDALTTKSAFDKVGAAIQNVQKVHKTAADAVIADQVSIKGAVVTTFDALLAAAQNISPAILAQIGSLDKFTSKFLPGSALAVNVHQLFTEATKALAALTAGQVLVTIGGKKQTANLAPAQDLISGPSRPSSAGSGLPIKSPVLPPSVKDASGLSGIIPTQPIVKYSRKDGGPIPGNDPTGIPILAHPKEFVIQRSAVEKYGTAAMYALNAGSLPKFAAGGAVDSAMIPAASLPRYDSGGPVPLRLPTLTSAPTQRNSSVVQHINQHNTFSSQAPTTSDLDYANRELGWRLSRSGRG